MSTQADPRQRVLVVDDDKAVRESLRRSLEYNGYDVVLASDGAEALATIGTARPDVVVMDVMMPRLGGLETTRALRAAGHDLPVLVLTARDAVGDRVEGLDAGADDYLTKPFRLAELQARLRALLRRNPTPDSPRALELGDLAIDLDARRVTVHGATVELRQKEHDLLVTLATNAGRVVTREQVMDEVWDEHWFGSTKTLDVTLAGLRHHLRDAGFTGTITTLRGVGYRFEHPEAPA